mmetsp:Transcript_34283/g.74891  ORF Transcript_34283/g.74891 Transcript_34283/m.74891 type:complete len:89 (-) Transcript_34283:1589-1855(-)
MGGAVIAAATGAVGPSSHPERRRTGAGWPRERQDRDRDRDLELERDPDDLDMDREPEADRDAIEMTDCLLAPSTLLPREGLPGRSPER